MVPRRRWRVGCHRRRGNSQHCSFALTWVPIPSFQREGFTLPAPPVQFLTHTLMSQANSNAENIKLISAMLCAALYPNVVQVKKCFSLSPSAVWQTHPACLLPGLTGAALSLAYVFKAAAYSTRAGQRSSGFYCPRLPLVPQADLCATQKPAANVLKKLL